jgi:hypothetical protein
MFDNLLCRLMIIDPNTEELWMDCFVLSSAFWFENEVKILMKFLRVLRFLNEFAEKEKLLKIERISEYWGNEFFEKFMKIKRFEWPTIWEKSSFSKSCQDILTLLHLYV